METETLNPEQSLHLIQHMIRRAQNNLSENGFLFIFWGWLVFVTALAFYVLTVTGFDKPWLVWNTMIAGGIVSAVYGNRQKKKEVARTYIDDYMKYVWLAFGFCMLITIGMGFRLQEYYYPIVIMLYATATFISGGLIRFTPLILCGALSYFISVAAFFASFETQILLLALSVLVSYIVPGHWLQVKFKKQNGHGA
jgi:hypothetical protein